MTMRTWAVAAAIAAAALAGPAVAGGPAGNTTTTTNVTDDNGHATRVIVLTDRRNGGDEARREGAFQIHADDGTVYDLDRDSGAMVLRTKDGHRYRVGGDSQRAFVLRGKNGARFRVMSTGPDGVACGPDHALVDERAGDDHEKTRVVICGSGNASLADRSTRLEHVLGRIQHMDGLSDSSRERVTAALRGAIEELRSAH